MLGWVVLFACCIALVLLALWIFDKAENTAYHKMQGSFNIFKSDNEEQMRKMEDEIESVKNGHVQLQSTLDALQLDINAFKDRVDKSDTRSKSARTEVDRLQEHNAKLREQQIELNDKLSKLRPVIRMVPPSGPIPIEVYVNPKSANTGVPKVRAKRGPKAIGGQRKTKTKSKPTVKH